ncbi:MAG: hypothetical protein LKJ69_07690 [Lactobacillus sp.]|jgi:two-component system sensor histidine kinase AgrC|nr:hypothetical protein [Lactobacillus sp.]MCI2033274.1 hypothetical protein [Lactobacillus sp.]
MYDVSVPNYLVIIMPMLLCLFSLQSIVLYHKIYVSYIIPISIVATAFSLFFTSAGEIIFGIIYGAFLFRRQRFGLLWFIISWEAYLLLANTMVVILQFAIFLKPNDQSMLLWVIPILWNGLLILATSIGLRHFRQKPIRQFTEATDTMFLKVIIFYSSIICALSYLIQIVFEHTGTPKTYQAIATGIFMLLAALNLGTIIYLQRVSRTIYENRLLKASETARETYYKELDQQQRQTRRIPS